MSILVVAEHDNTSIKAPTLVAVAAAQAIGGDIDLLVAGRECGDAVKAATQIEGVSKVLSADDEVYNHSTAENIAGLVVELGEKYSHILTPTTTSGKNFMPRVAALLDVQQISDISGVISEDTFERPIYAGNAIETVQSSDATKVLTVRGTAFDAVSHQGGGAGVRCKVRRHYCSGAVHHVKKSAVHHALA